MSARGLLRRHDWRRVWVEVYDDGAATRGVEVCDRCQRIRSWACDKRDEWDFWAWANWRTTTARYKVLNRQLIRLHNFRCLHGSSRRLRRLRARVMRDTYAELLRMLEAGR